MLVSFDGDKGESFPGFAPSVTIFRAILRAVLLGPSLRIEKSAQDLAAFE